MEKEGRVGKERERRGKGTGREGKDELNSGIFLASVSLLLLLLLIINFICQQKHKKTAIEQSIAWSNMLNSTERHKSAVISALHKIEVSVNRIDI